MQCNSIQFNPMQCNARTVPDEMVGRAVEGGCAMDDVAVCMAVCWKPSNLSHVLHSTSLANADITSVCVWCGVVEGWTLGGT